MPGSECAGVALTPGFGFFRKKRRTEAHLYSPFQKECPIWGPAAADQLLLRPVICGADVRPRGCREIALVSLARAAWAVAMQSAHARALLPALPWQLM